MAQNYTLAEAVQIAAKKENAEAMNDLGRRYPLLMAKIYAVLVKAGEDAENLLSYIPERVSANKVNVQIKAAMLGGNTKDDPDSDSDSDGDGAEEKKTMTKAERAKARREARKAAKTKAVAEEDDSDEDEASEDDEDGAENPYEGKNAMELFKLCKERGIAAKPKRSAKFYADLLTKADAEAAEDDTDGEDDDWDSDDDEDEKPAKKSSKKAPAKKAVSKKTAKADDDDEDDDWEI